MDDPAAAAFHRAMLNGADLLKCEIGYNPTRFNQMVSENGGVAAAKALLSATSPDASDGFTTLWMARRLDASVEAVALLPWYRHLFSDDELARAEYRLAEHGFDVARFLRTASAMAPDWYDAGAG